MGLVHAPAVKCSYGKEHHGGGGEIRTHERLPVAGFQDRCLKPLGHTSVTRSAARACRRKPPKAPRQIWNNTHRDSRFSGALRLIKLGISSQQRDHDRLPLEGNGELLRHRRRRRRQSRCGLVLRHAKRGRDTDRGALRLLARGAGRGVIRFDLRKCSFSRARDDASWPPAPARPRGLPRACGPRRAPGPPPLHRPAQSRAARPP